MPRYTVNCVFCGAKNHKRSPRQRTFKCRKCGEANFGPGMRRTFERIIELSETKRKPNGEKPAAAPVAQTTVIKAAKSVTPSPPKPAPKVKPPTPATAPTPANKQPTGGIRSLIYG